MFFSQNIQILRKANGLKQGEIQGFTSSAWSNYERGTSVPGFNDLIAISKYFGVAIDDLIYKDLSKDVHLIKKAGGLRKIENSLSKSPPNRPSNSRKWENQSVALEPDKDYYKMPQVVTIDTAGNENVVLVPVRARAGYLNGYADPDFVEKLPAYRLPGLNNGTFRLFEVEGLSMYPTLHGGDIIIGQNVDQLRSIRDDRVHVVITKQDGVVVKRVLNRLEKDGKLILKSDNYKDRDMYPPIVIGPDQVVEIWYATGYISRQMRPPADMYNRLIDLEGRLTLIEDANRKK
jgi:transcriptional regulator with XRE-family HTH domain/signal peptidase I